VEECTGAGPEELRVAPVVGLVGTEASWRSSRTERWHWSARQGLAADGGFKRRCSLSSYQRQRTSGSGGGGMAAPAAPTMANNDMHRRDEKRGEWRAGAGDGQRKSGSRRGELSDSTKNGAMWGRLSLDSRRGGAEEQRWTCACGGAGSSTALG
jgi:hypothetical protein